jgi:hypothetical protein
MSDSKQELADSFMYRTLHLYPHEMDGLHALISGLAEPRGQRRIADWMKRCTIHLHGSSPVFTDSVARILAHAYGLRYLDVYGCVPDTILCAAARSAQDSLVDLAVELGDVSIFAPLYIGTFQCLVRLDVSFRFSQTFRGLFFLDVGTMLRIVPGWCLPALTTLSFNLEALSNTHYIAGVLEFLSQSAFVCLRHLFIAAPRPLGVPIAERLIPFLELHRELASFEAFVDAETLHVWCPHLDAVLLRVSTSPLPDSAIHITGRTRSLCIANSGLNDDVYPLAQHMLFMEALCRSLRGSLPSELCLRQVQLCIAHGECRFTWDNSHKDMAPFVGIMMHYAFKLEHHSVSIIDANGRSVTTTRP